MDLIKFHRFNCYLKTNLQDSTLFFSRVTDFNDPFEGVFRYKIYSDYNSYKKWYLENNIGDQAKVRYYFDNKEELEKLLNRNFEYRNANNSVTCFSHEDNLLNILMWSHYAEDSKGLCLVFDGEDLEFKSVYDPTSPSIVTDPRGPYKISYVDRYMNQDPVIDKSLNYDTFLTTKFSTWSYEKEYRFIAPKRGAYWYDLKKLKMIVFGLRMDPVNKNEIKSIINSKGHSVLFKRIELSENKFEFVLRDD